MPTEPNPEAEERAIEMRYGPAATLVGRCDHPEHRATVNANFGVRGLISDNRKLRHKLSLPAVLWLAQLQAGRRLAGDR
jgi:hypothetical protein